MSRWHEDRWTPEEDERLLGIYNTLTTSELAKAFQDRTLRSIYKRAHRLCLPRRRGDADLLDRRRSVPGGKMKFWTEEEDALLSEHYGKMPRVELSKLFPGRTYSSLCKHAHRLGIPTPLKASLALTVQELNQKKLDQRKESYYRSQAKDPRVAMLTDARRRAKKKGLDFNIELEDIIVPEFCPVFGTKMIKGKGYPGENAPSLDRKDPSLGYVKGNVWVISFRANRIKNDASPEEIILLSEALDKFYSSKVKSHIPIDTTNYKILVIGESCRDGWIEGKTRLNPEHPTCVLLPTKETYNDGMAANVYKNIRSLSPNSEVHLISHSGLITKNRYLDSASGHTLLRIDSHDKVKTPMTIEAFWSQMSKKKLNLKDFSAIIISDYNKNFMSEDTISYIVNEGIKYNVPTFMDTKKTLGKWSKDVFCVKINEKEYDENIKAKVNITNACQNLVVTKGENGSDFVNRMLNIPTKKVNVSNVCGCGDTYHAALTLKYLETKDIPSAIKFANHAASFVATKRGVYAPSQEEIISFLNKKP